MAEKKVNGKSGSKRNGGEAFDIIPRCQAFAAEVFIASSGADRDYRYTICKAIQTLACELIYCARQANAFELGSSDRLDKHRESVELMNRVNDLLPVLRRCRCISNGKEKELNRQLHNLMFGYKIWMESDKNRFAMSGNKSKG